MANKEAFRLVNSRRLTGPNLLWQKPSAVIDVEFAENDGKVIQHWQQHLKKILGLLGWEHEECCIRQYPSGASLAFSAPIDVLYAATEVNDWCWDAAVDSYCANEDADYAKALEEFKSLIAAEQNTKVIALQTAAQEHQTPFLRDDDEISLGHGGFSDIWSVAQLPEPDDVDWSKYKSIPVALITGTNGKTSSTRLAAHILKSSGHTVGFSSTDWLGVNDEVVDKGDYSGPIGARTVLRRPEIDVAILETARGGLLRRGLGVDHANVALITNIAADHMGEFGVRTLDQLADVKWIVSTVLTKEDKLVLNAEDPLLRQRAQTTQAKIAWFSVDSDNELIQDHVQRGGEVCTVEDGYIVHYLDGTKNRLVALKDVPVTLGGIARHNVMNALGVVALTHGLGADYEAICSGLQSFSPQDNPGRCNLFSIDGVDIIADFAHNPHGLEALLQMAAAMPAKRRLLLIGQAGDRSDTDIKDLAATSVASMEFERILIKYMPNHDRGREPGEAARLLHAEFLKFGVAEDSMQMVESEQEALTIALDWAQPGDALVFLVHENMPAILSELERLQAEDAAGAISLDQV